MIYQILLAISYFHEINLVHRDLKLENIMVYIAQQGQASSMCCKVTDFGFASYCGREGLSMPLGTPLYMAPEIISQQVYDEKVDVWAFGVIAFCMLTSQYPFDGKSKEEIYRKIKDPNFMPNFNLLDRYW
jgi:serine/threonine protein kinase